jgi:hypothetical protein
MRNDGSRIGNESFKHSDIRLTRIAWHIPDKKAGGEQTPNLREREKALVGR